MSSGYAIKNQNSLNTQTTPQTEIKRLWEDILSLKAQTRDEAEDKFKLTLMFATMEQFQEALTAFMSDTENQLKSINQSQLKLLNLQKEYETAVRDDGMKIVNDCYRSISELQKKQFDKILDTLKKSADEMVERVDKTTRKCNQSAECAAESAEKMTSIKEWQDLLQWVSPAAVLLHLVVKVLQWIL